MPEPRHAPRPTPARSPTPAIVLALALLSALVFGSGLAIRQLNEVPGTVFTTQDASRRQTPPPGPGKAAERREQEGPGWETLNTPQKLALYPLAERWAYMSLVQKRRWLALAQTFHALPEAEQTRLHERMSTWASLSAQQRNQARINFAATQLLRPQDKRAQWEAYQALSAEEKQRLAARANAKPHGAATSIVPAAPKKLIRVPAAAKAPGNLANPPKVPPASSGAARIAAPGGAPAKPSSEAPAPVAPAAPVASGASTPSTSAPEPVAAPPTAPAPNEPAEKIYIN